MPPVDDIAKVGTLLRYMRMLCDDLRSEASNLSHRLVADRVASGLVSLLLTSMPPNKIRANVAVADQAIAPFFVRRLEQFIEQHAGDDIALADLTGVAGGQRASIANRFRRFRDIMASVTSDDLLVPTRRDSENCPQRPFIAEASVERVDPTPMR
jgi:hypothetical protein